MISNLPNELEPLPATSLKVRLSYWVLTHWSLLRRAVVIILILISAALFSWSIWKFIPTLRDPHLIDRVAMEVAAIKPWLPAKPEPLIVSEVTVLTNERGSTLVATITNNNEKKIALNIHYVFELGDGLATPQGSTWLLPGQTRYVAASVEGAASGADLKITSLNWQRISNEYPNQELNIKVTEAVFEPPQEGLPPRLAFMATNNEPVSFRQVYFTVVIKNYQGQITAAGVTAMNNLLAGQQRAGTVSWYSTTSGGGQIIVEPLTDPFSASNVFVNGE